MWGNKQKILWRATHYFTCLFVSAMITVSIFGEHFVEFFRIGTTAILAGLLPAILFDRYYSRLFRDGKSPSFFRSAMRGMLYQIPATIIYLVYIGSVDCGTGFLDGMYFTSAIVTSPISNAAAGLLLGLATCLEFQMYLNAAEMFKRRERFEQLRKGDVASASDSPPVDSQSD